MAQYQADFSGESLGVKTDLAGWTRRWDYGTSGAGATMEIVSDVDGQGGKALRFTGVINSRNMISLDALDADANRDHIELAALVRFRPVGLVIGPTIVLRGSGSDAYEEGAVGQLFGKWAGHNRLQIHAYDGGSSIYHTDSPDSNIQAGLYWLKFKVDAASNYVLEIYDPANLSLIDSHTHTLSGVISGVGWAGLFTFHGGVDYDVLDVLAATNGDTVTLYTPGAPPSDTTAPVLSSPTSAATGSTTASGGVTTDEGNGTLYAVCSTSITQPSIAQLKAGQDHTGSAAPYATSQSVSATGAQAVNATGLTASTGYYWHFLHTDAAANDSNIVSSAQFTTNAGGAAVEGLSFTLYQSDGTTPAANLSNLVALWWDAATPTGAPAVESTTESTDGSGAFTMDVSAGALAVGQTGFLLLYDLDGSDHRDSLVFAGREAVVDIS